MSGGRSVAERKRDVLQLLEANGQAWLATGGRDGRGHLIAVAAWWDGELLTIATVGRNRTARNLDETHTARLAFGTPDDAVLVDVAVSDSEPAGDGSSPLATGFAAAMGWNPGEEPGAWQLFRLRPTRIQAYRGYGETEGSTVMRGSDWEA